MAKKQETTGYWASMLETGLYKRNQGRLTRQLTGVAFGLLLFIGMWVFSQGPLSNYVRSYFAITVKFAADGDSPEEALTALANEDYPGTLVVAKTEGKVRIVEIRFPTSSWGGTDSDLRKTENLRSLKLQEVATNQWPKIDISKPVFQTRQIEWVRIGIPVLLALLGAWMIYRTVNYPRFTDFLVSVEAEMDKVTWASKQDLYRSTAVVIGTMFFLGFALFVYDLFWQWVFQLIGFLQIGPEAAG